MSAAETAGSVPGHARVAPCGSIDALERLTVTSANPLGRRSRTPFAAERFDRGIFEPGDDAQLLTVGNAIYKVWISGPGYVAIPAGVTYKIGLRRVMRARGLP